MCKQPIKVLPPPATAFGGSSIYLHMICNAKYIAHLLSIIHPMFIWTIPHMLPILFSATLVSFVFICTQSKINWKIKTPEEKIYCDLNRFVAYQVLQSTSNFRFNAEWPIAISMAFDSTFNFGWITIVIFHTFEFRSFAYHILCISLHLYPSHVYSSSIPFFFYIYVSCPSLVSLYYSKKKDLFQIASSMIRAFIIYLDHIVWA